MRDRHLAVAGSYFNPAEKLKGIRLDIAEYRRPDPKTAPSKSKAAGLYMICTISKHAAEAKGYADAMMLDWRGQVAEATGANVFFVKDGVIHTPDAGLLPRRHHPPHRHRARQASRHRGDRAASSCRKSLRSFEQCFLTGIGRRSDAGLRDRPLQVHALGEIAKTLMNDYVKEVHPAATAG